MSGWLWLFFLLGLTGLGLSVTFTVIDWQTRGPRYLMSVAIALTATIFAGWHKWGYQAPRKPKDFEIKKNRLVRDFAPKKATRIRLTHLGQTVELNKVHGRWQIAKPVAFPANSDVVETLLTEVQMVDKEKTLKGPRTSAQYGLKSPKTSIEIFGASAKTLALALGGADVTGTKIFVAKGTGTKVYLVGKHFGEALQKGIDDLRETTAVKFRDVDLKSVTLGTVDGKRAVLSVDKKKIWTLKLAGDAFAQRANSKQAEEIVKKLQDLQASRFLADGKAALATHGVGAGGPAKEIVLDDGKQHILRIGGPCDKHAGELKMGRPGKYPVVFCARKREVRDLLVKVDELRDARLTGVEASAVTRIEIKAGAQEIVLRKGKKSLDWKVVKPAKSKVKVDIDQVEKFVKDLRGRTTLGFLSPPAAGLATVGLDKPSGVIVLTDESGRKESLSLGKENEEKNYYAQRSGEKVVVVVHRQVANFFRANLLRFRSRTVLSFGRNEATEITATRGALIEKATYEGGVWKMTKPLKLQAGTDTMNALFGSLTQLQAERFVGARPKPEHGLAVPTRTITIRLEKQEPSKGGMATKIESHTLKVGKDTGGGGCFGQLAGKDASVFVLKAKQCEDLRRLLVTRRLVDVTEYQVKAITLTRGGAAEVLIDDKGTWKRKNGPKVKKALVVDLISAMSTMRASKVASYGKPLPVHGLAFPRISLQLALRKKGATPIVIKVGAEVREGTKVVGHYGIRQGRDVLYILPVSSVETLKKAKF